MVYFTTLLISMFITIALIPLFMGLAQKYQVMDIPDQRKVHAAPIPRCGGLAMAVGALVPAFIWAPLNDFIQAAVFGSWVLVFFGLLDDWKGLSYRVKFAGQIAAALVMIIHGGVTIKSLGLIFPTEIILPEWAAVFLTLVVIVGVTNAINLADGLDGLAGGISLISFICIGYLAYRAESMAITLLAVAASGSILGFLRFNTYPAVVFMGDAGSQLLGFLAISLALSLTQDGTPLSPTLPLLLLGFPILDTLTVMIQRIAEGRSPFAPDKSHFHHRLLKLGLEHNEAVLTIYAIQVFLAVLAFSLRFHPDSLLVSIYIIFAGLAICSFYLADKTGWRVQRYHLIDIVIKGRLRVLLDARLLIKAVFKPVEILVPALFLFTCFLPRTMPFYFSLFTGALALALASIWLLRRQVQRGLLRFAIYMTIPYLVYLSQADHPDWLTNWPERLYNLSFALLVMMVILTLKLSQREGFRSTPMDFLILLIALIVPALPDEFIRSAQMHLVAVKIIAMFFSYEVLLGELRGKLGRLGLATWVGLVIICFKGLW
ncbi:MAG: MraY family glycosyltransferase [Thermodesulfobacteriota bacterium]